MLSRRVTKIAALGLACMGLGVGAAAADAGTFTKSARQVTWYYAASSGNAATDAFQGGGTRTFSGDAPGTSSQATYVAEYIQVRSFAPDAVINNFSSNYYNAAVNRSIGTDANTKYKVRAVWNYSAASGAPNGYVRSS